MGKPWTPDMLADCWGCSGETVRQLIRSGQLPAFRVGRMLRVKHETVEAYECGTIRSEGSKDDTSSHGTTNEAPADVISPRAARPGARMQRSAQRWAACAPAYRGQRNPR
ncbi:helix-turn-helix domain-containing protein [Paracoccus sp. DMF]|uniref:helix-turn-helix domain-containing protein n=1 Tax=Paracoccus sp. DMF TaxID=400837 RepID=UPI001104342B